MESSHQSSHHLSNNPKGRVPRACPWGNENSPVGRQAKLVIKKCHGLARGYLLWAFPDQWTKARDFNTLDVIFIPKGDVSIGNDVWIGRETLILSGVTIGDGAVIGARAVVTKDVEPYSIVAGNPARLIRKRFDDKTIHRLLEIRWWDWPPEKINENLHVICTNNLEGLLSLEGSWACPQ